MIIFLLFYVDLGEGVPTLHIDYIYIYIYIYIYKGSGKITIKQIKCGGKFALKK